MTAIGQAAATAYDLSPSRVHTAIDRRVAAILQRGKEYERWRVASATRLSAMHQASDNVGRDRSKCDALEF
jgi:hypothetical protein